MSKKMPSGTNFFKALIKEDPDEHETLPLDESLPEQNERKTPEIDNTAKEIQIQDVVKVMEQAASTETKAFESLNVPLPDVSPIIIIEETQSKGTNENQIKKRKKKNATEDIPSYEPTQFIPVNSTPSTASTLKQRGFYITSEQYIKIKVRAAQEDCDGSQIVRNALDAFFGTDKK